MPSDCHRDSARASGWRQGCRIDVALPIIHIAAASDGKPTRVQDVHSEWLLADQDCDLAWKAVRGSGYLLELRPVFYDDPPDDWGIRNPRFLLADDGGHTDAYGAGLHRVIEVCNEALATGLVCALRYKRHYYTAQGLGSGEVTPEFAQHAAEEQDHADDLRTFLGKTEP
ncbi:hypothetical protein [Frankia sp. Cppng1_Ct_nod]|uniref:hypothetical protein n=1 Tax=Frankia sp. Cppng1_Ct_nod TaxID=2897162 RepID=UPI001A94A3ED|nr:hypothetical protein [Frankia sp. Cppng1_Ct_nod]